MRKLYNIQYNFTIVLPNMNNNLRTSGGPKGLNRQQTAKHKTPLGFLTNNVHEQEDNYALQGSQVAPLKMRPNSINSHYNTNSSKASYQSVKQLPKTSQMVASTPQKKNSVFQKNGYAKNKNLKNGHKSTAKLQQNREVYSQLNILGDPNKNINSVSKLSSAKSNIDLLINLETEQEPIPSAGPKPPSTVVTTTNGNTKSFYKEGGSNQSSVKNLNSSNQQQKKPQQPAPSVARNLAINISKISQFQPSESSAKRPSERPSIGKITAGASSMVSQSQGSSSKRQYLYCIDTKQIISMIEYSIHMLQIPIKEIQDYSMNKPPVEIVKQQEIFCAGNQDLNYLARYINDKLVEQEQIFQMKNFKQAERQSKKQSELFKQNTSPSQKYFDKSKQIKELNFAKIFNLEDSTKFTYFVENEKILSNKMFFVDSQRSNFIRCLKDIKQLLTNFIKRKYKDCITKIGFSSEKEIYNIFSKMLSSSKNFFGKINTRKVLQQFWLSIKDVFDTLKVRQNKPLSSELQKLSYSDEVMLKNNYYLRLEIVSRGRYIYEGQSFPLHTAIFTSNLRNLSKLLKLEVEGVFYTEKNQLDPCGNTPLMLAVKLGSIDAVKILSDMYTCPKLRPLQELMNAKEIAIAMKNPQILKILISSNQKIKQQFFEQNKEAIFRVLEKMPDFQVDLNLTCDSNWFPVFSSVAPSDTYKIYKQGSNLRLDMTLLGLQKFNLIKGNITMLYKGRGSGDNEGDLLVIDNKFQTVSNIFNRNQEAKINTTIQEILSGKQILKKFQTHSAITEVETDKYGRPIAKKVNGYDSEKYILKSRYTMIKYQMNLNQIDQIKGLNTFQEYIEALQIDYGCFIEMHLDNISYEREEQKRSPQGAALTSRVNLGGTTRIENPGGGFSSRENSQYRNLGDLNNGQQQQMHTQEDQQNDQILTNNKIGLQQNKQITVKKKQPKQVVANLWLSKTYPFNIDQFLPLIHVLSFCSKQIRQFNKFLLKYQLPHSHECFPIEARIPLFMTMEAVFSFKNIQMNFNDKSVFEIDKEVSVKQQENMAIYAKQQISYLNMHSSLDTQEDKQAKALKEIYKLCKTDEGDQSEDYIPGHENLYKVIEINQPRPIDGYESENSDKIKDLFNKMITKEDEEGQNDLLMIEENNYQEDLLGQGLTPSAIQYDPQVAQSRNFAKGGSSFHDIKNSLTHSDLLRLRKSGQMNGRTPSKQFSLQSDITESVEVSERSFNDKLAKLQIHSFQNVKFMSQFKKNSKHQNLEQILAEQFQVQPNEQEILMQHKSNLEEFKKRANKINNMQFQGGLHLKNDKILAAKAQFLANHPEALQNHMKNVSNVSGLSFHSYMSSFNHGENIYDSKINEERPKINKSLGKHQINNNLHMWTKMGAKIYKDDQPHINEQPWEIRKDTSVMTIQKDFQPTNIPRQKREIKFLDPSAQSFAATVSGIDNISGTQSNMQSVSSLIVEAAQKPNSTADSSLRVVQGSTISKDSAQLASDKDKLKLILSNLRNDNNQPRPRYLNTIESEGNLPTQQIGKTSLRSIVSLPSEGSEEQKNSSHHRQNYQHESRPMHTGDAGSEDSVENVSGQIFSYEKQHRTNDFTDLSRNMANVRRQDSSSQQPPDHKQLCPKEQLKLNFFQKVSNFIQESITERKHPDQEQQVFKREIKKSQPKKLYHRKFENNSAGRKVRDFQEEGGSPEGYLRKTRNTQLQTKFTCTDGDRIESENKRASLLALETYGFIKNKK